MREERPRVAIVLGGAEGVWNDFDEAKKIIGDLEYSICAVNEAGRDYPGEVALWCSLHPEELKGWLKQRRNKGYPEPRNIVGHKSEPNVTLVLGYLWPTQRKSASSGIYCAKAALEKVADRVILCGVPLGEGAHYFDTQPWTKPSSLTEFRQGFEEALPYMQGKVKSMSGFTREKLGAPTLQWVKSANSI